jgi:hypothetical protein
MCVARAWLASRTAVVRSGSVVSTWVAAAITVPFICIG